MIFRRILLVAPLEATTSLQAQEKFVNKLQLIARISLCYWQRKSLSLCPPLPYFSPCAWQSGNGGNRADWVGQAQPRSLLCHVLTGSTDSLLPAGE
jgi:hypothetical protein